MTYQVIDIPSELRDTVHTWRQKLIETVAEYDALLLEKFFDDPATITEQELAEVVRKAVIDMAFFPVLCGSSFKNKGVQALLDAPVFSSRGRWPARGS